MNVGIISASIQFDEQSINDSIRRLEARAREIKLDICPEFCRDAFTYKIDETPLRNFERSVQNLTKTIQAQTIKMNLEVKAHKLDPVISEILRSDKNKTITIRTKEAFNQRTGYQANTQELVVRELKQVERAIRQSKPNGVIQGVQFAIGQSIAKNIDRGIRDNFGISGSGIGKAVVNQASKPIKFLVTENPEFQEFLGKKSEQVNKTVREFFYKIGDAATEAIDLDPNEDRVAAFKKLALQKIFQVDEGITQAIEDEAGQTQNITVSVRQQVTQKLKQNFKSILSETKTAANEATQAIFNERVKGQIGNTVGDKLVQAYRMPALQERAIPEVQKRVEEILAGKRKAGQQTGYIKELKPTDETLLLTIGGYAGQAKGTASLGMSSKRIAADFRSQNIPGLVPVAVQGNDTDFTASKMEALGSAKAMLESISKPNLRGYSTDAVEMASQAVAALQKNPNLKVKFFGESGGGFAAAEAKQLMDLMGYQSEYLAVGTPDLIGGLDKNTKNRLLSPDEHLGKDVAGTYKKWGLANMNVRQQKIPGIFGHTYEYYQDALQPEIVNFLMGKPEPIEDRQFNVLKRFSSDIEKYRKSSFGSDFELQGFTANLKNDLQLLRRNALVEPDEGQRNDFEEMAQQLEDALLRLGEIPNLGSRSDEELFASNIKGLEDLSKEVDDLYIKFSQMSDESRLGNAGNSLNLAIQNANERLKQFNAAPGIANDRRNVLIKDLARLQQSIKNPANFKYDPGDAYGLDFGDGGFDITNIGKDEKPELSPIQLQRLQAIQGGNLGNLTEKGQAILQGLQGLQNIVGENLAAVEESVQYCTEQIQNIAPQNDLEQVGQQLVANFQPAYLEMKGKIQSFNDAFAVIKKAVKDKKNPDIKLAQTTASFALGNIERARQDVEGLREQYGIAKIGSSESGQINQLLGQLNQVENKIKTLFTSKKIELPEISVQYRTVEQVGQDVVKGIENGIQQELQTLENAASEIGDAVIEQVKSDFEIQSPSKVMQRIGQNILEGLQNGLQGFDIKDAFSKILDVGKLSAIVGVGVSLFQQYGDVVKEVAREFEAIEVKFNFATGGISEARQGLQFVREESNRLGLSFKTAADNYANLAASTRNSPLEGFATRQIFTGVQEAATVRQLNQQDIEGVNRAIQQIKDKGTAQREEIVGQLGERLSGSLDLAARSRGQTVGEFSRDTQRSLVNSDEFLPGFAQALSAEASLALPNAVNSSSAILNRFQNQVERLQITLGKPLLAIENTGLQALTAVIEVLNKSLPLLANMLGVVVLQSLIRLRAPLINIAKNFLTLASTQGIVTSIGSMSLAFGKLAAKAVLLMALVEAIQALQRALSSASGELGTFANSVDDGLSRYRAIRDETVQYRTPQNIVRDKELNLLRDDNTGELILPESALGQGILSWLPDRLKATDEGIKVWAFSLRGALQEAEKLFGDYAKKAKEDRLIDAKRIIDTSKATNDEISDAITGDFVKEQAKIKAELTNLGNRRRAIAINNPGDETSLRQIREQEEQLLKAQEAISKPTLVLSQQNANTVEVLKKSIAEFDRLAAIPSEYQADYRRQADELRQQLEQAEKAQSSLNRAIRQGLTNFTLFAQRVDKLADTFRDLQARNQTFSQALASQVNAYPVELISPEQAQGIKQQLEIQLKVNEYGQLQQTLTELRALINEQGSILQPYGINSNTGVAEAQRVLEQLNNDPSAGNAKLVLEKFIEYRQLEQQLPQLASEVTQAQADFARSVRDSAKAVQDYYRELTNTSEQLAVETRQIQNTTALTNAKSKLKQALVGNRDSFVSQYVEGLINLVEQLNQPLQNALEAQKQIIQQQQQRVSQQLQLRDLQRSSPVLVEGQLQLQGQQQNQNSVQYRTPNQQIVGAIASPSTTQSLQQVLEGSVSRGQGFFGSRSGGKRQHRKVDLDSTEGLGGHAQFNAIFPGNVVTQRAWRSSARDRVGGEESNALRIATPLSNGMQFFTDYGHVEIPNLRVNKGDSIQAGQRLGRLSGNDTFSQGGHLDLGILIPTSMAGQFKTTAVDANTPGYSYVEPKEFMKWYQQTQVGKRAGNNQSNQQNSVQYRTPTQQSNINKVGAYGDDNSVQYRTPNMNNRGNAYGGRHGVPSNVGNLTDFIKHFENFKPNAYWDYGHYSIGYGTPASSPNERISQPEADKRLRARIAQMRQMVIKETGRNDLSENQLNALTSLSFNAGSLRQYPKLLRNVKSGNWQGAAAEFLDINKAQGRELAGLTRRRRAESEIFLSGSSGIGNQNQNSVQYRTVESNPRIPVTSRGNQDINFSYTNNQEIARANQQLLANSQQQESNIRAQLGANNQLAQLDAEISRTKLRNQFDDGLKDAENQANQAFRMIQNQRQGIGFETPEKQRYTQIRDVNREFADSTRDLTKQLTELQSARRTLAATKKIIEQGGFPQLQGELPQISDGIKRLDDSITVVSNALGQASKVRQERIADIDNKFTIEERKRTQEFNSTTARNMATNLRQRADSIEIQQRGNIGDLSLGDPIELRRDAERLETLANLDDQIAQLEELGRNGQRTKEQIEQLKQQYEELSKLQLDSSELQKQREIFERLLKVEARDIQIERKSVEYERERTNLLAQRNELLQQERPGDLSIESPTRMRLANQIATGGLELREAINQTKQFAFEQGLSEDATKQLVEQVTELDSLKLDNLRREMQLTLVDQLRRVREQRFDIAKKLSESDTSVKQAQVELVGKFGVQYRTLEKDIAIEQQNQAFLDGMKAIEDYAKSVNLSADAVARLQDNLRQVNELKLDGIQAQFDPFQQVIGSSFNGLQSSLEGLFNGTMNFEDAWVNFTNTIGNTLAKLAAEWLTNEFVTNILGIGKGKGSSSPLSGLIGGSDDSGIGGLFGGLGGLLTGIFGFKEGGNIGNYNHSSYRELPVIGEALKREGHNSVLIAATPGEHVLNTSEARLYRQMFPQGIKGYRLGGSVEGLSGLSNMSKKNVTNNVGINITGVNNSENIDVDALRHVVIAEIARQQELGGLISNIG